MTITYDLDLNSFNAWSGAVDTLDRIQREGKCEELENILEDVYPDGMTETQLNDLLWFDSEQVYEWLGFVTDSTEKKEVGCFGFGTAKCGGSIQFVKPPYQAGDILYVRETVWQKIGYYLDIDGETKPSWYNEFKYVASDEKPETGWNYSWAKRPSIHMPKEAARIWLKVTDVRVERLQEITEDGAKAEGANFKNGKNVGFEEKMNRTAIERFVDIWNSTIKKSDRDIYDWDANPYVFVIEFIRIDKPEEI